MSTGLRRWLNRGAVSLGALFVVAVVVLQLTGHSYFWTALRYTYLQGHTTAHIDDSRNFAQAPIIAGSPTPWAQRAAGEPVSAQTASLQSSWTQ